MPMWNSGVIPAGPYNKLQAKAVPETKDSYNGICKCAVIPELSLPLAEPIPRPIPILQGGEPVMLCHTGIGQQWLCFTLATSYNEPVPNDILYYGALYKRFFESVFLTFGGRGQQGQGGTSYFDPRQAPPYNLYDLKPINDQFQVGGINLLDWYIRDNRPPWGRKENFVNLEIGLGFMDGSGNFYNFFYSETLAGYNTAKLQTVGFLVNMPFNL
jgi:hypothetical protein